MVLGRFEDAETAARQANELNGNDPMYRINLSYIYTIQGRYQDALDVLDGHIEKMPERRIAEMYMHKAVAMHALGRLQEAQELAEKIDALDPIYESLEFASLYAMQGDLDKAFAYLEKASKEFPRYYVEYDPYLKAMTNDPRWQPVLEQFDSGNETSDQ